MMANLCGKCLAFKNWDLPRIQRWSGAKFAHHQNATSLHEAALNGCHLCNLIEQALLEHSDRPKGETSLPERQIWLECCEADIARPSTVLKINIEPESLATAGHRDIHSRDTTIITMTITEIDGQTRKMMQGEKSLGLSFWVIITDKGTRYFYGDNEIHNEDLFFALANPYHQAILEVGSLPERIVHVLDSCNGLEDQSTGSKASFNIISGWLKACIETHVECKRWVHDNPPLPTRVLDIEGGSGLYATKLLVTEPGQRGSYAALSHRWGDTKPLTTTKDSLFTRQQGILDEDISQTFRDAISITRELGMRYLWIDSLCIIQDSKEDWEQEASRMASIYRNAHITIAAVDAEDDKAGCFSSRNGLRSRPCKLDLDVSRTAFPSGDIHIFPQAGRKDGTFRPRGPIDSRAWVLQEQLLSPRVINYKRNGVYWECLVSEASETVPEGIQALTGDKFAEDIDFVRIFKCGIGGILNMDTAEARSKLHRSWQLIVQAYSRRSLTKETDKFAAILGIVDEMTRCTGDRFVSGVWEKFLPMDLLWCVYGRGCPTIGSLLGYSGRLGPAGERHREFRAPSWSWLNIKGSIRYIESHIDDTDDGEIIAQCQTIGAEAGTPSNWLSFSGTRKVLRVKGSTRVAIPISYYGEERIRNALILNNSSTYASLLTSQDERIETEPHATRQKQVSANSIEPKTWHEAHQWFRILNRTNKWVKKNTDLDDNLAEVTYQSSSRALEEMSFRAAAEKNVPSYHKDFLKDMEDDVEAASLQYSLFSYNGTFKHVGLWAPDVLGEIPVPSQEMIMEGIHSSRRIPSQFMGITFIGIMRKRGLVRALGVLPVQEAEGHYYRIGMGWFEDALWEKMEGEDMECTLV